VYVTLVTSPTFHKLQGELISDKAAPDARLDKIHFVLGHKGFAAFDAALDKAPELSEAIMAFKLRQSHRNRQS
jgi:hypothetical protein